MTPWRSIGFERNKRCRPSRRNWLIILCSRQTLVYVGTFIYAHSNLSSVQKKDFILGWNSCTVPAKERFCQSKEQGKNFFAAVGIRSTNPPNQIMTRNQNPSSLLVFFKNIFRGDFFLSFLLYSALLHLPPLRFHCADGCWDRTQDRCSWCIGTQTL